MFGALGPDDPPFTETTPYDPRSPYSATKAASDHLVRAWHHTYGLPTIVTNTTNNYGPWQFPEKLIPLVTLNALEGKPLPVYGDGSQPARLAVRRGPRRGAGPGAGARRARRAPTPSAPASRARNLQVVQAICAHPGRAACPIPAGARERLIRFVTDRPGHDFRYEIDPARAEAALGWRRRTISSAGSRRTIDWYLGQPSLVGGRSAPAATPASGWLGRADGRTA